MTSGDTTKGGSFETAEPKRYPKDIMLLLYDPKKRFLHVMVELENRPGALAEAAEKVARLGLNVMTGFTSVDQATDVGIWSFFAECKDRKTTPEDVKKAVQELKSVREVQVVASTDGLLTEGLHFPLRVTPGRAAMAFNPSSLDSMFERMVSIFGSGASLIIFEEGESVGKAGAKFVKSAVGEDTARKRMQILGDLLSGYGWGLVDSMDIDEAFSKIDVRVRNCFEAQGRSLEPKCHFVRGMFVGFFSEIAGAAMTSSEVKCAAQGNQFCEFLLKRK